MPSASMEHLAVPGERRAGYDGGGRTSGAAAPPLGAGPQAVTGA
jgi:hypothetical protein